MPIDFIILFSPIFTVNEPWDKIPLALLKEFYWRSYQIIQLKAPHWITLLHDSFRLTKENFGNFMQNCDNYAIDSHIYQAWAWENTAEWFQARACEDKERLVEMEQLGNESLQNDCSFIAMFLFYYSIMLLRGRGMNGTPQKMFFTLTSLA